MAASAQFPLEARFSPPVQARESELIEGRIVERAMPNQEHAAILYAIIAALVRADRDQVILGRPELRLQTGEDRFRIADLALYVGEAPADPVPRQPPAVVVEILSPDDPMEGVMEKLCEYEDWGVAAVCLVAPRRQAVYRLLNGVLQAAEAIEVPGTAIRVAASDMFTKL
jgi:Uma2 family endonuclease